jgi:hypothetical protein
VPLLAKTKACPTVYSDYVDRQDVATSVFNNALVVAIARQVNDTLVGVGRSLRDVDRSDVSVLLVETRVVRKPTFEIFV